MLVPPRIREAPEKKDAKLRTPTPSRNETNGSRRTHLPEAYMTAVANHHHFCTEYDATSSAPPPSFLRWSSTTVVDSLYMAHCIKCTNPIIPPLPVNFRRR